MEVENSKRNPKKNTLVTCGILVLVGIALIAITMFLGYQFLKSRISTEPEKAKALAQEIMDYDIPGGSKGTAAVIMGYKMAIVQSLETYPNITLVLAAAVKSRSSDFQQSVEQQLNNLSKREHILVNTTENLSQKLCGQDTTVIVKEGTMKIKDEEIPITSCETFINHNDKIIFALVLSKGDNHRQQALKVIGSLQCKNDPNPSR